MSGAAYRPGEGAAGMAAAKAELRRQAFALRDAAHGQAAAHAAQQALAAHLARWRGRPLAGYLPIRSELDPRPVMAAWDGPVGVPVIEARDRPLVFALWQPEAPLVRGPLGTARPAELRPMTPAVLIVPLVAFDAGGMRLGYGGGYYDRTLARLRAAGPVEAVGFAYAAQELPAIPAEATDLPLDAVVTEAGVRVFAPPP